MHKTNAMAKKKLTKDDYPIVKYRIVTGNGYTLYSGDENGLKEELKSSFDFADRYKEKRFAPQYVVRVIEEYVEIDEFGINGTE